jgi:hypothetical protein
MTDITDIFSADDWKKYGETSFMNWGHFYSQREFVEGAGKVFGLRDSLSQLLENSGNHLAKKAVVNLMMPKNPALGMSIDGGAWVEGGSIFLKDQQDKLADYSARGKLERFLDGEGSNALILKLGNAEANLLYNSSNEDKAMIEIIKRKYWLETKQTEKLRADIPAIVKKLPAWHQVIFNQCQHKEGYLSSFMSSYISTLDSRYDGAFKTGDHYDKGKLQAFYNRSISSVTGTPEERAAKLKPVHLMTAETLLATLRH